MATIDPLTVVPLHLEPYIQGAKAGDGTGFVVDRNGTMFLVTNWHLVTMRHPETNQPLNAQTGAADPVALTVWFHDQTSLGTWRSALLDLLDPQSGQRRWLEHPLGRQVDVVALPLSVPANSRVFPLDLTTASFDLIVRPSEPVSIIGFPLGLTAGGKFPIWKTGHVASDLDLNYMDKPIFLIDATTKPAMSGSPVVARRINAYTSSAGFNVGASATRFLGVYSGRINENIDPSVGYVWKPPTLEAIFAGAGL
jgi:hypothetical protein